MARLLYVIGVSADGNRICDLFPYAGVGGRGKEATLALAHKIVEAVNGWTIDQETAGRLTDAQFRACDWLPADGSWRSDPGRLVSALYSLSFAWPGCLEHEWTACGPRGGMKQRWRLNARGVEIHARPWMSQTFILDECHGR